MSIPVTHLLRLAAFVLACALLLPAGATAAERGRPGKARIVDGRAVPPPDAPRVVRRVIAAANRIRNKPYRYGGGHRRWEDSGYDCSGAVSYALHGGGLLKAAMPSGGFTRWGRRGAGRWITVYANSGHAFVIVAGLRFDTGYRTARARRQGVRGGRGPRWDHPRSTRGFVARHPAGL